MTVIRVDTSGAFGAEVVIDGLDAVLNGLETMKPKLRRDLERQLRELTKQVAETARRQVRSRTGDTAAGYKVERRGNLYRIRNKTRGAAILEFAATPHSPQGETLVSTLNEVYGRPGRILWESWDVMSPWVTDQMERLVTDAELYLEANS